MQVSWATSTGHPERAGHVNGDFVGSVTDAVVLLDGAGIPGAEHFCSHGVEWYTRRLGAALLVSDGREDAARRSASRHCPAWCPGPQGTTGAMEGVKAALRAGRNTAGGFWVAKDQPAAAHESVRSTLSLDDVTGVGLFSNGASRFVHRYQLADWPGAVRLLSNAGPPEVIRRVREAEDGSTRRDAGWDAPDDATVAWLRPDGHRLGRDRPPTRLTQ